MIMAGRNTRFHSFARRHSTATREGHLRNGPTVAIAQQQCNGHVTLWSLSTVTYNERFQNSGLLSLRDSNLLYMLLLLRRSLDRSYNTPILWPVQGEVSLGLILWKYRNKVKGFFCLNQGKQIGHLLLAFHGFSISSLIKPAQSNDSFSRLC